MSSAVDGACDTLRDLLASRAHQKVAPQAIFAQVEQVVRALGFEHCAYGLRLPVPFTNRRYMLLSNYAAAWQQRYAAAGYVETDPTVRHGTHSLLPVVWSNELFANAPQLWAEARSFGLRVGWAQSCFDGWGQVGMLTVARSHEAFSDVELVAIEPTLSWLAIVTHAAISPMLIKGTPADVKPLTRRECEVLSWSADGKSSAQMAAILRISANTVNFHVRNTLDKLQVPNRTAAVARAAALGLLDFRSQSQR